jgi:adenylate cyclase
VRDQVRDKLGFVFEELGEQQVKNLTRPVRVYACRPGALADPPAARVPPATSISQPIAQRQSIVVLPFANLGRDPAQQYFTDGITEDRRPISRGSRT